MKTLKRWFKEAERLRPPPGQWERIARQVELLEGPARVPRLAGPWRWAAALLFAAAMGGAGWRLGHGPRAAKAGVVAGNAAVRQFLEEDVLPNYLDSAETATGLVRLGDQVFGEEAAGSGLIGWEE